MAIINDEPKVSQKVLDEHKTAGDEDPYRALKMVNLIVWLIVIFFIVIGRLTMLSGAGFSSGEEYTPNADFS